MYEMRVRVRSVQESPFCCTKYVFEGPVSTPGGYFATDFWEGVNKVMGPSPPEVCQMPICVDSGKNHTSPLRRESAAPSTGRTGFLRAGSKKSDRLGFPPVRLRIRRAMGRARRPCRPRKTLLHAWELLPSQENPPACAGKRRPREPLPASAALERRHGGVADNFLINGLLLEI